MRKGWGRGGGHTGAHPRVPDVSIWAAAGGTGGRGRGSEGEGRLPGLRADGAGGGGGLARGHGSGSFAFGGAGWPLALAHSDPLGVVFWSCQRSCRMTCVLRGSGSQRRRPGEGLEPTFLDPRYPPCHIPSGCGFFTGPWTVTRLSLRMLRQVPAFAAFAEPSGLCVGAVLNVAGCAVCASAAPSSWRNGGCAGCCGGRLTVFAAHTPPSSGRPQLPRRVSVCVRPRCPAPHGPQRWPTGRTTHDSYPLMTDRGQKSGNRRKSMRVVGPFLLGRGRGGHVLVLLGRGRGGEGR